MRTVTFTLLFVLCQVGFCRLSAQTVKIQGNTYMMGNDRGEEDEKPEHKVTLSSFEIDKNEVTEAQYEACVQSGKCTPAHYTDGKCLAWTPYGFRNVTVPSVRRDPDLPVVCVTWFQARAYCQAHNKSLPTEAQWEYAASTGKKNRYSWGDNTPSPSLCTMASNQKPEKVGSFSPNDFGLNDMTGNVWEWTADFYAKDYYSFSHSHNPPGPEAGHYRVIRGGGWYSNAEQLRITNRNWFSPDFAEVSIGFRCVNNY